MTAFRKIIHIILSFALLLSITAHAESEIKHTNTQLEALLIKIKNLKNDVIDTQSSKKETDKRLQKIDFQIADSASRLAIINGDLHEQQLLLSTLQKKQDALAIELNSQRDLLEQQLRNAYLLQKQDPIKMIFSEEDVNHLSRTLAYYRYFSEARLQLIETMRDTLDTLHENEEAIYQQTVTLKKLKEKQVVEKQSLLTQHHEQSALLKEIAYNLRTKNEQLAKFDEDKKALTRLLEKLQKESAGAAKGGKFALQKGQLPLPTSGKIVMGFNESLSTQTDLALNGIIIAGPEGQPVKAVAAGKVVFADWLRGMGLLLIIDHGNGYMTLYGHNQTLQKGPGDYVQAGDTIAALGQSGGQKTPGLYFGIRHNSIALNPVPWLGSRLSG
ncbi:MAG: peptidase [Gammaproteobacteria bacterium]|nr:peptidase [Gammaproteobacteria bacterium]